MADIFVSNNTDPLTEMSQAMLILPYIDGVYVAILIGICLHDGGFSRKRK